MSQDHAPPRPGAALAVPADSPPAIGTPLDMVEVLKARLLRVRGRPKRARTRARILAATAEEIGATGYPMLTVERICERAGIARGTFYLYFSHRSDAAIAVYRLFWATMRRWRPRHFSIDLAERVRVTNAFYVATYACNNRLLSGQIALASERPDFAQVRDMVNHRWSQVIARILPLSLDAPSRALRARALAGMVDDLLRDIYGQQSPTLAQWRDQPFALAHHISEIWLAVIAREGQTPPDLWDGAS
ncbi:MAG: TetR/AcrR family transcriptional regulator [Pararhodobacter sp.]|nr:TetR/AcrR family transcriptional regulator [Pararhodobacter sp.]